MIVFKKRRKNVIPAGIQTIELPMHYPMHSPLRYQVVIPICQNHLIEKKLVQEQLNDEKTIKKTTISFEKNDVRNDKKWRRYDHFLHLKDDLNDGN